MQQPSPFANAADESNKRRQCRTSRAHACATWHSPSHLVGHLALTANISPRDGVSILHSHKQTVPATFQWLRYQDARKTHTTVNSDGQCAHESPPSPLRTRSPNQAYIPPLTHTLSTKESSLYTQAATCTLPEHSKTNQQGKGGSRHCLSRKLRSPTRCDTALPARMGHSPLDSLHSLH